MKVRREPVHTFTFFLLPFAFKVLSKQSALSRTRALSLCPFERAGSVHGVPSRLRFSQRKGCWRAAIDALELYGAPCRQSLRAASRPRLHSIDGLCAKVFVASTPRGKRRKP